MRIFSGRGNEEIFRERECKWTASDVPTLGNSLTQGITNALWTIDAHQLWTVDGHHEVFANQGFSLPSFAVQCVNYNHLELWKHRKRHAQEVIVISWAFVVCVHLWFLIEWFSQKEI